MNKLRIEIRAKDEHTEDSKKLSFSTHSREEALKRIQEERSNRDSSNLRQFPIQLVKKKEDIARENFRSTIFQKLFETTPENQENPQTIEANEGQTKVKNDRVGQIEISTRLDDLDDLDQSKEEEEDVKFDQYPFFPGIYPSFYRPEEGFQSEPLVPSNEKVKEDYLDIGPIYKEKFQHKISPIESMPQSFERNRRRGYWLKLFLSVVGAIGLGVLFGYLLLMILLYPEGNDTGKPTTSTPQTNNQGGTQVIPADQVELDTSQGGKASSGLLTIADRTFYAIQAGVFTDEQKGKDAASLYKQNHLPTLLFNDDVYRVFLGIGYKKEDTEELSGYMKDKGTETYMKSYTIPGGEIRIPNAKAEQMEVLNKFLTHGTYLLEKTSGWSGDGVIGKVNITPEAWNKFKETHQLFLQEGKQTEEFLFDEQKRWVNQMSNDINLAVNAMVSYINQADQSKLIESQQGLLGFFEGYRQFLISTGVDVAVR